MEHGDLLDDSADARAKLEKLRSIFEGISEGDEVRESEVKRKIIEPVLEALGWFPFTEQETDKQAARTVDYALFGDKEKYALADAIKNNAARKERVKRLNFAATILEAKKLHANLGSEEKQSSDSPESQILGYLEDSAETNKRLEWGILTNGRVWRLYWRDFESASEKYFEIDLLTVMLASSPSGNDTPSIKNPDYVLSLFALFFSPHAFKPVGGGTTSFLNLARGQSEKWRVRITEELSGTILEDAFPKLVNFIAAKIKNPDTVDREKLQVASLTFLFRLLFILYAEDRKLLPVQNPAYERYSLRVIRDDIEKKLNSSGKGMFSSEGSDYWSQFAALCRRIDRGDKSLGIPPYNGGLFDEERTSLLAEAELSDRAFVEIFDRATRAEVENPRKGEPHRKGIDFFDINARDLGTIYERLSQYDVAFRYADPKRKAGGEWRAEPNRNLRKDSGTYYTPEDLVQLILDRTLTPLAEECEKQEDPAAALLELKIVDPAMGSGHFLVSATDWLTKRVESAIRKSIREYEDKKQNKPSGVLKQINTLRKEILGNAEKGGWTINPEKDLDRSSLVRRMVLKQCIHGVDKNLYAVEVAKLALWLHSFTVGAPLSFLDHHIQHGDSLFGESVDKVLKIFNESPSLGPLLFQDLAKVLARATERMREIENTVDVDLASVKHSEEVYKELRGEIQKYLDTFAFLHALRWQHPRFWVIPKLNGRNGNNGRKKFNAKEFEDLEEIRHWMRTQSEKLPAMIAARAIPKGKEFKGLAEILPPIYALMDEENFFAWELAFPHIWTGGNGNKPRSGFDAVISNPPWERIKLQNREWFSIRDEKIAKASTQSARDKMITGLKRRGEPLYKEYEEAVKKHEDTARIARESGYYPLLSGGDINYYALFVEQAQRLIQEKGLAGMVTPNGLATDYSCAEFFQEMSATGRVSCLFDFENKKIFFPDVHAQFRFLISVIGGENRKFAKTECAFLMHSISEYETRGLTLTAKDFKLVNPNTGTAPLFRSQKDIDLIIAAYDRLPVLYHHEKKKLIWPVQYSTPFHMAGASHLFRTEKELMEQGFERVVGKNILRHEKKDYVPLYQGRMIHQFDHRFATVRFNEENLHNPYITEATTAQEHTDTKFLPTPHNWIPKTEISARVKTDIEYFLGFRDITNSVDSRTMFAAIVPRVGFGHTLPLLLPLEGKEKEYKKCLPLLLGNFNSFVFDYIARCKLQSTHMTWYILEQLPVVPLEAFRGTKIGKVTAEKLVREDVVRLTYTAHDLDAFGRDHGYNKPFKWDEERRRHLRARLDALFFILYGFTEESEVSHILDSFEVAWRKEKDTPSGEFGTRRRILNYFHAFRENKANAWLSDVEPYE